MTHEPSQWAIDRAMEIMRGDAPPHSRAEFNECVRNVALYVEQREHPPKGEDRP